MSDDRISEFHPAARRRPLNVRKSERPTIVFRNFKKARGAAERLVYECSFRGVSLVTAGERPSARRRQRPRRRLCRDPCSSATRSCHLQCASLRVVCWAPSWALEGGSDAYNVTASRNHSCGSASGRAAIGTATRKMYSIRCAHPSPDSLSTIERLLMDEEADARRAAQLAASSRAVSFGGRTPRDCTTGTTARSRGGPSTRRPTTRRRLAKQRATISCSASRLQR